MSQVDIESAGGGVTDHDDLTNVTANQHHTESHTLASHSTKAHSELTGVGADDHHAQSHTHASHTSIGTNDHHNQAHGNTDHTTGVAPANVTKAAAAEGSNAAIARADHKHDITTAAPSIPSLPDDGAGEGSASSLARSDHSHAREGFGNVIASTWNTSSNNGSVSKVNYSDHRHGIPPSRAARVYNSANQSIANATSTSLTFDSESYDTDAFHSTSVNTNRLTIPATGYYLVLASMTFAPNAVGQRYAAIQLNGTTAISGDTILTSSATISPVLQLFCLYYFTVGDYIEFRVYQDSGGALNSLVSTPYPFFSIQQLGV